MCFPIAGELEKTMAECIIESELETEAKVVRRLKNILDKEIQEISTLKRNVSRTLQEYTSLKRSHEVSGDRKSSGDSTVVYTLLGGWIGEQARE